VSYQFLPGKRFRWSNTNFRVIDVIAGGQQVRIEDMFSGERKNVEVSELVEALFKDDLRFEIEGKQAKPAEMDALSTEYRYLSLEDCPERLVRLAKWRLEVIQPLLDRMGRSRAMVEKRVADVKAGLPEMLATIPKKERKRYKLSVSSVYRWIRDYEASNANLRALIDNTIGRRGGGGKSRLNERVEEIVQDKIETVYLGKERVRVEIEDVCEAVACQIEQENGFLAEDKKMVAPSYSTIARRIAELDPKEVYRRKHGREATRRKFKQYGKMQYPELPQERAEIDHTSLDLIVLDLDAVPLGRLTFTHCMDTATRYPLGYYLGFEPPSYLTVMECLKHAIMPKNAQERYGTEHEWLAYGIPNSLAVDNGREFRSHGMEDACQLLGIILEPNKARSPWQKPTVERFFRTSAEGVIHTLPGTTFSNILQRGDYKSVKEACIFVDDIDRIANIFLLDYYAEKYHRGLKGIPARHWEAMTRNGFFPRLPANLDELTILLCPYVRRCVWHYGIDFEGLRYNTAELVYLRTELKGAQTKVKYDPGDLSQLYVQNPFDDDTYITVPSLDPDYTQNLSLWKHRVIKRVARQHEDEADLPALWRAKQRIQEIIQAGLERKKMTHRKIARYLTNGKPTRDLVASDTPEVQIIDGDFTKQEETKQLPSPNGAPLFTLDQKSKEGWEIVERGLAGSNQKGKKETE
jgi:putative transposase